MESLVKTHLPDVPWYMKSKYEFMNDWFLLSSPFPSITIVLAYLVFVLKLGPALMKNREPFKLKTILLIYNTFQVALSFYLFVKGSQYLFTYGLVDTKCVLSDLPVQKMLAETSYFYFIAKITELADTIFFVLRKKTKQITFLHIYHHCIMMLTTFVIMKYCPTYSVAFLGTINSFVHVLMYAYYGLAAFPSMQKYLWWKKYLTSLQLVQFVMILIQIVVSCCVAKCPPPRFLTYHILFNGVVMIYLFTDFYVKSYRKKDNSDKKISKNNSILKNDCMKSTSGVTYRRVKN